MKVIERQMSIFELDTKYTIVHCISLDCKMSAGIAKQIDNKIPEMKPALINFIKENNTNFPITINYATTSPNEPAILNMITKENYWNKPTYPDFEKALKEVAEICDYCNVKYLAMPKIGCGLDGLNWNKVKKMIESTFNDLDIEIVICYI